MQNYKKQKHFVARLDRFFKKPSDLKFFSFQPKNILQKPSPHGSDQKTFYKTPLRTVATKKHSAKPYCARQRLKNSI